MNDERNESWKREPYNGHPSWFDWNVRLWLCNHEPFYVAAIAALRSGGGNVHDAAAVLRPRLPNETPDGAPFSRPNLVRALLAMTEGRA